MRFFELLQLFPTEEAVIHHFIKIRYPDGVKCNHCGSEKAYKRTNPRFFDCGECSNTFSIFKGTIFEKTTTDLRKWMYAIHLFLNGKKGISGYQLKREIGVTYKCAWRMLRQIRQAMGNSAHQEFIDTIIEMDETYIGGKPRKENRKDDRDQNPNKRGRGTKKIPVVGVIDRINKRVHAKVALPNKEGKKLTGKQLLSILKEVCKKASTIITDEFKGYNILSKEGHFHLRIDHTKEYANNGTHTNTMESFWATLQRGIMGIYHHVSTKYLQHYVNEFCFRYNHRENGGIFDQVLRQAVL